MGTMKPWLRSLVLFFICLVTTVQAVDVVLVCSITSSGATISLTPLQNKDDSAKCSGMYSRKSWGGNTEPYILVKFLGKKDYPENVDPIVSVLIWEWQDGDLRGKPSDLPLQEVSMPPGARNT